MEKTKEYIVEYRSKKGGYTTTVDFKYWTKKDIDLYWEEEVAYWLDEEAEEGDRLILKDAETFEIIKENYI